MDLGLLCGYNNQLVVFCETDTQTMLGPVYFQKNDYNFNIIQYSSCLIMIIIKVTIIVIRLLLPYQTYCRSNYLAHYGLDGPLAEYQPPPSEYGNDAPDEPSEVDNFSDSISIVSHIYHICIIDASISVRVYN